MTNTDEIIKYTSNRNYPIPETPWKYYQEWHKVLLLHWKVPVSFLEALLPEGIHPDLYDGNAWISLLPLTVKKHQFKGFPAWPFISNFHEVNLRTYVTHGDIAGVYILSIETDKLTSVLMGRCMEGLPYIKSTIERTPNRYLSENINKQYSLDLSYIVKDSLNHKSGIDYWLTERHALYESRDGKLYCYNIHHKEWELKEVQLNYKYIYYQTEEFQWPKCPPDKIHYCKKLNVLVWPRVLI